MMPALALAARLPEAAKNPLRQEENRRKEDQKGHQFRKGFVTGKSEKDRADQASKNANGNKSPQPRFDGRQVLAIAVDAAGGADHQRQGAGGVGDYRRRAKEQQRGESDESAASRDRIDRPRRG